MKTKLLFEEMNKTEFIIAPYSTFYYYFTQVFLVKDMSITWIFSSVLGNNLFNVIYLMQTLS